MKEIKFVFYEFKDTKYTKDDIIELVNSFSAK